MNAESRKGRLAQSLYEIKYASVHEYPIFPAICYILYSGSGRLQFYVTEVMSAQCSHQLVAFWWWCTMSTEIFSKMNTPLCKCLLIENDMFLSAVLRVQVFGCVRSRVSEVECECKSIFLRTFGYSLFLNWFDQLELSFKLSCIVRLYKVETFKIYRYLTLQLWTH